MEACLGLGRWSWCSADGAGWKNIGFALNGTACRDYVVRREADVLIAVGETDGWREELRCRREPAAESLSVTRFITNTGSKPLDLESILDGKLDDAGEVVFPNMGEYWIRYVYSGNVRTERLPRSRPEYPYVRPIPYAPVTLGVDDGNQFPVLLICDEGYKHVLVEGDLNQTSFVREWELGLNGGSAGQLIGTYRARQIYPSSSGKILQPGETAEVSSVYYQVLRDTHPQDAFAGYLEALRKRHAFAGEKSPMRHGAVFCTWNFGTYENISAESVAASAQKLARDIHECTHYLIDDGYQAERKGRNAGIDSFYPVPAAGFDPVKFPRGMKEVAGAIREAGLTPCIWLSPKLYLDSKLAADHPDWILRSHDGRSDLIGETSFLDLSVEPARRFFLDVLDTVLTDWTFKGLKFDFMTHWFTLENARYRNGSSGPEWRDFLFGEIRKRVGPDGLFMTCIAMSMGNPFPGLFADCYRCGCDIHMGTWPEQLKAVKATLPQILLPGRHTFLPNMDSAGFGDVPRNEQLMRLAWVFITQGVLEIGGQPERWTDEQIRLLRRLLARPDRGNRVRCLDERAFTGDGLPEMLAVDYPDDSPTRRDGVLTHLAFFNWSETTKAIGLRLEERFWLRRFKVKEYWTGKDRPVKDGILTDVLPPRSSALYEISEI
ncbi:MAG: alpha-galactosidase [Kiritimatiellae bacterium]|nr:alpha-galactosidase [Kiritimatiellia bacterium]